MRDRDLEQQLKQMRRMPTPASLDQRMDALFDDAGQDTEVRNLEQRLKRIRRVPVPVALDRRMERLFDTAEADTPIRHPWRMPVWAAAAIGLVLVASFFIRGGFGPEPLVVEIMPDNRLEQFLLGGQTAVMTGGLEIFTRGDCAVKTVWPADAPGWDRRSVSGRMANGDPQ